MINLQSTITRNNNDFLVSELGNEMVVMNIETGDYLGLNEVSSDIWKLLEKPNTPELIISQLLNTYHINREQCEEQTLKFLQKMEEQKMIKVSV